MHHQDVQSESARLHHWSKRYFLNRSFWLHNFTHVFRHGLDLAFNCVFFPSRWTSQSCWVWGFSFSFLSNVFTFWFIISMLCAWSGLVEGYRNLDGLVAQVQSICFPEKASQLVAAPPSTSSPTRRQAPPRPGASNTKITLWEAIFVQLVENHFRSTVKCVIYIVKKAEASPQGSGRLTATQKPTHAVPSPALSMTEQAGLLCLGKGTPCLVAARPCTYQFAGRGPPRRSRQRPKVTSSVIYNFGDTLCSLNLGICE